MCYQVWDLFGKNISKKNARTLIAMAKTEGADLKKMIENTYDYHTQVERCRSVVGAISYAIENGGWAIYSERPC